MGETKVSEGKGAKRKGIEGDETKRIERKRGKIERVERKRKEGERIKGKRIKEQREKEIKEKQLKEKESKLKELKEKNEKLKEQKEKEEKEKLMREQQLKELKEKELEMNGRNSQHKEIKDEGQEEDIKDEDIIKDLKHQKETCTSDPNFAVICSFLEKFGGSIGIPCPTILELQNMLESEGDPSNDLITFQVRLLRKLKKSVSMDKWERALIKFCFTYSTEDGWELDRFGYKRAKLSLKIRIVKNLCEAQFDLNAKFKLDINKLESASLRMQPIGKDKLGNAYWFQVDAEANIRVYREDLDEETWELVADCKEQLEDLVEKLSDGETYTRTLSQDEEPEDDSMQGYEDIIRDTGPVESNATSADASRYNSEDEDTRSSFPDHSNRAANTPERSLKNKLSRSPEKDLFKRQTFGIENGVKAQSNLAHSIDSLTNKTGSPNWMNHIRPPTENAESRNEKFIPLKKRGLSESPVDFSSKYEGEGDAKKQKLDIVSETITESGNVEGRGLGSENEGKNMRPGVIVGEEISEAVFRVVGHGIGVDCDARNVRASNGGL